MYKARRLGTIVLSLSCAVLYACSGDSGTASEDGASAEPGTETGGQPAASGGAVASTGGADAATGGSTAETGGVPMGTGGVVESPYHPGFQATLDVLSGFRIGRPDYSCASADCHSGGHDHSAVPLRLVEDEELYTELTTHISEKCGNIPVVTPGDPANSALIKVLKEGCDDVVMDAESPTPRMPYGCEETEWENTCVADEHIAAVEQWILDGAPQF